MEINKDKKQKEVTRFMVKPSYALYLGVKVEENTDIEDEEKVEQDDYSAVIQQTIKGNIFTTEMHMTSKNEGYTTTTETRTVAEIPYGTILVWYPGRGYVVPSTKFESIEEVQENFNLIKDIKSKDEENNKKIIEE